MRMPPWEDLPPTLQTEEVRPYYEALSRRGLQLRLKRLLDVVGATVLFVLLGWLFVILALLIKLDSPGPVFFRQRRVTQFGREFRIVKFRTMTYRPVAPGDQITRGDDPRITRVGAVLRRYRLDEISQLIDILRGTMSFVGTRPEVPDYVRQYTPQMRATLLLPAGVTSTASIEFKDEAQILAAAPPGQDAYVTQVLPAKMRLNLRDVRDFSIGRDLRIAFRTILAVAT
ncbi:sugar transferase [Actinomyces naeslundii]|nr:sugar transferase [Actinomyces naeslundii]